MDEDDIDNMDLLINKVEKIQEALKPLGYKIRGFKDVRRNDSYFKLNLVFVGKDFFSGENSDNSGIVN